MGMQHWYLVMTKLRKEPQAKFHLERANLEVFYPTVQAKTKTAINGNPMFPRYLFVKACLTHDFGTIRFTPGVQSMVQFGAEFVPIPERVIEGLRSNCDSHDVLVQQLPKRGQHLLIRRGPFKGYEGIFCEKKGKNRVIVLLKLLYGESKPLELDLCCVQS